METTSRERLQPAVVEERDDESHADRCKKPHVAAGTAAVVGVDSNISTTTTTTTVVATKSITPTATINTTSALAPPPPPTTAANPVAAYPYASSSARITPTSTMSAATALSSSPPPPTTAANPVAAPAVTVPAHQKPRKTLVTFNPAVRYIQILHLNNYTDEEMDATWSDYVELTRFKADVRYCVKLMERGELIEDTEEHSTRGLEYRTVMGARRREANKEAGRDAVFDEQEYQWDNNLFVPERIAHAYQFRSRRCHYEAHMMGLSDERTVREFRKLDFNDSFSSITSMPQAKPDVPRQQVKIGRNTYLRRFSNAAA